MFSNIKKLKIDMDGTLTDSVKCIVDLYNEDFLYYPNYKHINWWDINTWDFKECHCASTEQLNNYFNQPRFFDKLEMMPWAERVINELQEYYQIDIITMGSYPNLKQKKGWVKRYFPNISLIAIDIEKYDDKSHIDMSDSVLIDDSYSNLITSNAAENICFGDTYSWNEKWDGKRCANWMDIRKYLL